MHDESIEYVVARNARNSVLGEVERVMSRIEEGEVKGTHRKNPFFSLDRGNKEWLEVPGQAFANAIIQRGLNQDAEFLASLKQALDEVGKGSFFDFFSAIDGEGEWSGPPVRICGTGGQIAVELHDAVCRVWESRQDLKD